MNEWKVRVFFLQKNIDCWVNYVVSVRIFIDKWRGKMSLTRFTVVSKFTFLCSNGMCTYFIPQIYSISLSILCCVTQIPQKPVIGKTLETLIETGIVVLWIVHIYSWDFNKWYHMNTKFSIECRNWKIQRVLLAIIKYKRNLKASRKFTDYTAICKHLFLL